MASLWTLFVIVLENACGMVEDGTGAVLMTSPILYFDRFDGDGLLDLRDCSVQVVAIEITPLRCKDLNQHVVTDSGVTFYLGEAKTECVSI